MLLLPLIEVTAILNYLGKDEINIPNFSRDYSMMTVFCHYSFDEKEESI